MIVRPVYEQANYDRTKIMLKRIERPNSDVPTHMPTETSQARHEYASIRVNLSNAANHYSLNGVYTPWAITTCHFYFY